MVRKKIEKIFLVITILLTLVVGRHYCVNYASKDRASVIEDLRYFIWKGLDVDVPFDDNGSTLLMSLVAEGDIEAIRLLIRHGVSINAVDKDGNTALMFLSKDDEDLVRILLDNGADIEHTNCRGMNSLMSFSGLGLINSVKLLLKRGAHVDIADKYGTTALMFATVHTEIVKILLECGAAIDLVDNNGLTALIYAAGLGYTGTVRALVESKANIEIVARDGWTALIAASCEEQAEIVTLLLDEGATRPTKYQLSLMDITDDIRVLISA